MHAAPSGGHPRTVRPLAWVVMGIDSPVHLIFIGIVALLVLGPRRLPEMARALGHGLREFREAMNMDGEHPLEHPPVVSHPVVDPAMPQQQPAGAVVQPSMASPEQMPAEGSTVQAPTQGDPLADSFSRAEGEHADVDPDRSLPSPDASDRRAL